MPTNARNSDSKMDSLRIKSPAVTGTAALAILAVLFVAQLASIGESDDAGLELAIRSELVLRMGGSVGEMLENLDPRDSAAVDGVVAAANADNIDVHSMRVSKPLFDFDDSFEAVVRVEFTLPGEERTTQYWRFTHSVIAGWRYRRPTSMVFYYLNFI